MELSEIIGDNIINLRKSRNMTQKDLADIFNYTPKAVSKWERGETIPEVGTLKAIAEYFGVTVDCLLQEKGYTQKVKFIDSKIKKSMYLIQSLLIICIIWTILSIIFVYSLQIKGPRPWMAFIWGVPLSFLPPIYIYRSSNKHILKTVLYSLFMWSLLAAIYIQFLFFNFYLIFLIGIPAELSIVFGYRIILYKAK